MYEEIIEVDSDLQYEKWNILKPKHKESLSFDD